MNIRHVTQLGVFALLLFPSAAWAEVGARFVPETTSLFIYEPFLLRLDVESDAPPETPELPAVPDLTVTTIRRLPSDPIGRKHAFQFELIAERDGILNVPPVVVRADGETVLTSALRLRIRSPRPATEMALAIAVDPTTLRVGQPATVTVTWTSTVPFTRCKQLLLELPLLTDSRCRLFPLEPSVPDAERIGLPVNNLRLLARRETLPEGRQALEFRFTMVPREPCVLRTSPARLVCALLDGEGSPAQPPSHFYNHFFEAAGKNETYEQVYLSAPAPEITVAGLGATGRNSHFAHIVGTCNLRTSVAPTQLVVGQPALFSKQQSGGLHRRASVV